VSVALADQTKTMQSPAPSTDAPEQQQDQQQQWAVEEGSCPVETYHGLEQYVSTPAFLHAFEQERERRQQQQQQQQGLGQGQVRMRVWADMAARERAGARVQIPPPTGGGTEHLPTRAWLFWWRWWWWAAAPAHAHTNEGRSRLSQRLAPTRPCPSRPRECQQRSIPPAHRTRRARRAIHRARNGEGVAVTRSFHRPPGRTGRGPS